MGSRSYIGFLEGSTVTYCYCHQGSYIDSVGYELMDNFTKVDDAKALATGVSIHSIVDGEVDRYDIDKYEEIEIKAETMILSEFESIDLSVEIDIESLYLYKHGEWRVKSRHTHDCFFTDRWHFLEDVVEDLRNKQMLEMMRDYAERDVEFFCGSDVLDVEVVSGLCRDVRGVHITLTS